MSDNDEREALRMLLRAALEAQAIIPKSSRYADAVNELADGLTAILSGDGGDEPNDAPYGLRGLRYRGMYGDDPPEYTGPERRHSPRPR